MTMLVDPPAKVEAPSIALRIVPLAEEDMAALLKMMGLPEMPRFALRALLQPGCSFAALVGERIIGAAGVSIIMPGVAEAAAFLTAELKQRFPVALHKAVLAGITEICRAHRIVRLQTMVEESFVSGQKWALRLGFNFEGRMPRYLGDDRTFLRYAKIWR